MQKCCLQEGLGFSGGSVVNNSPANAGDRGLIPGLGDATGQISPRATTTERMIYAFGAATTEPMPQLLKHRAFPRALCFSTEKEAHNKSVHYNSEKSSDKQ